MYRLYTTLIYDLLDTLSPLGLAIYAHIDMLHSWHQWGLVIPQYSKYTIYARSDGAWWIIHIASTTVYSTASGHPVDIELWPNQHSGPEIREPGTTTAIGHISLW